MPNSALLDAPDRPHDVLDRPVFLPDRSLPLRLNVRNAVLAAVVGVLAAVALAALAGGSDASFRSRAVLTIDQPLAIANADGAGVVEKLSVLRGKYAGLLRTDVIAEPVAERTGASIGEVRGALTAEADPSSLLLDVHASAGDARSSKLLATAAAEALIDHVAEEQAEFSIPEAERFTFEVVVPAAAGREATDDRSRQVKVGLVGLVVAAALAYGALELLSGARRR